MRKLWIVLLVALAMTACSASKRINRIAERHGLTREATLTIRDTVAVPALDTVYIAAIDKSGIFIVRDTVQKFRMSGMLDGDSVIVCVHRYTDTVIVEKQVPYTQIVTQPKQRNVSTIALIGIILWVSGFLAALFYKLSKL